MSTARHVAQSLFPDLQAEKAVGPILPSVFVGTNAELMRAVAPYYLTGSVLDVTHGEGGWWTLYRPAPFTAHDLYKLDGVDFRQLPEADDEYDTVCFDPPYVPQGGAASNASGAANFRDRYGLLEESTPWRSTFDLIEQGLVECARVSRDLVLVKCGDFVTGGAFTLGHFHALKAAETIGLHCHDLIVHHTGSGPGGHNIFTPIRARRHHSYLLVFTKVRVYS